MRYLDPSPDRGEERRRVDDGDGTECFWVIGSCEFGSFLEMRAERPHGGDGDGGEVDDGGYGGDGLGLGFVREVSA